MIQRKNAKKSLTLYAFRDRVEDFARWASGLAVSLGRPKADEIHEISLSA